MSDEEEFNERLKRIKHFEQDLKDVFLKHKIELKEDVECWHGGSQDVIRIFVDGRRWYNWEFSEVLTNINVIK